MSFSFTSCSCLFLSIKIKNEQLAEIQRPQVVKHCNAPFAVRFLLALWKVLCFGQISLWVKSPVAYCCITPPTVLSIYLPPQHTYFLATLPSWLSVCVSQAQSYSSPAPLCGGGAEVNSLPPGKGIKQWSQWDRASLMDSPLLLPHLCFSCAKVFIESQ